MSHLRSVVPAQQGTRSTTGFRIKLTTLIWLPQVKLSGDALSSILKHIIQPSGIAANIPDKSPVAVSSFENEIRAESASGTSDRLQQDHDQRKHDICLERYLGWSFRAIGLYT